MDAELLRQVLEQVAAGQSTVESAAQKLLKFEDLEFAKVDYDRVRRQGFPEVVWGPGKTSEQLVAILGKLATRHPVALATRIEATVYQEVRRQLPDLRYYPIARICALGQPLLRPGVITILTAGTSDLPVAEEASVTAELCGFTVERISDVGVAGLHRLLAQQEKLSQAQVLIVVAGMEGALPSVVGGLVSAPVIAVPTSIGYGASFGGIAALLGMLNSCASGIGVVNIDNGFGAAMLAARMLNTLRAGNMPSS